MPLKEYKPGTDQLATNGLVAQTEPMLSLAYETFHAGDDFGSPVTDDYPELKPTLNAESNWVEIDASKEGVNLDHLMSPSNACMLRWELSRRLLENA